MQLRKRISWSEPIDIARGIPVSEDRWVLLHSGLRQSDTGRYSIIAMLPDEEVISSGFSELEKKLTSNKEKYDNSWFGYLGYGLKNCLEKLSIDKKGFIELPNLLMVKYRLIIIFDHEDKEIDIWAENDADIDSVPAPVKGEYSSPKISNLQSNMTKEEYLSKVKEIREYILNGDIYQANLTRKFFGNIDCSNKFELFTRLCEVCPSSYSAYIKMGDMHIISSSPERFLKIERDGVVNSLPIKGTSPRYLDNEKDIISYGTLCNSEKDRAENLMIVDLMRNDFSKSCVIGSVKVDSLFDISSYANVHHMSSSITGLKRDNISTMKLVKNCFPAGSMTGAPKIKAMEICSELEGKRRNIYSGAIGYFGGDGSADLSVVIRTVIIEGDRFELQAGGGIVADSTPESEFDEIIAKVKSLCNIMDIDIEDLKKL